MNFLKKIKQSQLFKIVSFNSLSILIKTITALISSKFVAIYLGPQGITLIENIRNFSTTLESLSTLGFQNGTLKYVAENEADKTALQKIISTSFISLLAMSFILAIALFSFSNLLNLYVFEDKYSFSVVFKLFAIAIPFYVVNILSLSILNGLQSYSKVIFINIVGYILGITFTIVLILKYSLFGAFLAVIFTPALLGIISLLILNRELPIMDYLALKYFDFDVIKKLKSYTLMALVSGFSTPIVYLAIRNNIIDVLGVDQAGFWSAICRLSSYYMMFITTIVTLYFYPKLIKSVMFEENNVIKEYLKTIIPILFFGMIIIYFLRYFIIEILFTKEFYPVTDLFIWQLLGDFIRAIALIFGYLLLARRNTLNFIISELLSVFSFYIISINLIKIYNVNGVVISYFCSISIYLIYLLFIYRRMQSKKHTLN